jgi:type IV secretory pathway VirB4 component
VGELAGKDPDAHFHIISKDKGFDPLIKHLKGRKIRIQRERDLAEIPILRVSNTTSSDEKIAAIVKNLGGRGQARPRKVRTLENTINTLFTKKLDKKELSSLIKELQKRKLIVVNQSNVSYKLPH